mmetsp:Transcript_25326/g.30660  ORF Transcript_25326/g.30660 Transcript_25326/m.30660 type:complete len:473 (+) Transcript_25326:71-1489(+)|eukprot:CAMPEP_0172492790 /NCGR_PEP_ID=MMETSP1066-20121228/24036_1 /TAXON_ID=671091 /ORGANISM="Coscinodiscus wailesii, Strain CCMP2513" /LENGTH=472 /DNA_ID=CAMNT_0013262601 /DNA_START=64 /DNA_END=1482 /DNA_ORIENTATION=+
MSDTDGNNLTSLLLLEHPTPDDDNITANASRGITDKYRRVVTITTYGFALAALVSVLSTRYKHQTQFQTPEPFSSINPFALKNSSVEDKWIEVGSELDGSLDYGNFGFDVAISDNATILVIGEPYEKMSADMGTLRVFRLNTTEDKYHEIADPINGQEDDDNFGWSVAVTSDGDWIAASAPNQKNRTGAVRFFQVAKGNGFKRMHKRGIEFGDEMGDYFGFSIAMSDPVPVNDTHIARVVVGAPAPDSSDKLGYARVMEVDFARKQWERVGTDINGAMGELFGSAVGMSSGGNVVVVGTPPKNKVSVYFQSGLDWMQQGEDIVIEGGTETTQCGASVDVSADGKKVVIGCELSDTVHTYYWKDGVWKPIGKGIKGDEGIGQSVSMSARGSELSFGEPLFGDDARGRVKIFYWDKEIHDWAMVDEVEGNPADKAGSSVSISARGDYFAMGAPYDSNEKGDTIMSGEVRVFKRP